MFIILGAGASYTSGYPLAADLRKLFSSAHTFGNYLREKIGHMDKPSTNSLAKWFSDLYLFAERVRKHSTQKNITHDFDYTLEVVLACPGAWHPGENISQKARPNSPVAKLAEMLRDANPNMVNRNAPVQIATHNSGKNAVGGIICYDDFKSFIEAEM